MNPLINRVRGLYVFMFLTEVLATIKPTLMSHKAKTCLYCENLTLIIMLIPVYLQKKGNAEGCQAHKVCTNVV